MQTIFLLFECHCFINQSMAKLDLFMENGGHFIVNSLSLFLLRLSFCDKNIELISKQFQLPVLKRRSLKTNRHLLISTRSFD